MTDSFDRNLDAQARRLAEISDAIDAALAEEPHAAKLHTTANKQSYDELTDYNVEIREQRGWIDTDLDTALTDEHRESLERWRHRLRVSWETPDIAAVGVAGVVGLLAVWCDSAADGEVAKRLERLTNTKRIRRWETAGKRLPIDYTGVGFGGRTHRAKSAGHDLARVIEALRQIMDSEFRGVSWSSGERQNVSVPTGFREVEDLAEAMLRLMQHLAADVLTPMSLPIPGTSWLWERGSESMKEFGIHAYSGLRAGKGWNIRSTTAVPGFAALVTEVIIRTHVHADAYRRTGTAELGHDLVRKRSEMLLAAHSLVGAASIGKAAAALLLVKHERGVFHPAAVRHAQLPALMMAGYHGLEVVNKSREAREHEARSWDDLLLDDAQVWQLDLSSKLEDACANRGGSDEPD